MNRQRAISLPDDLWERIKAEAAREDRSANWIVNAILKAGMDDRDRKREEKK